MTLGGGFVLRRGGGGSGSSAASRFRFLDGGALFREADGTNAVRGRRVEAALQKVFEPDPVAFVVDMMTPGADAHEAFEAARMSEYPTSGRSDQKPDNKDKEHFEDRFPKIGDIRMPAEDKFVQTG